MGNTGQCSESACVSAFRSCQYGEAKAFFSDGNKPQGTITGVMTQQSVNPAQCNTYVMGGSCSKEYAFSVTNGFITMISTSSDACVPGSALQYQNYQTKCQSLYPPVSDDRGRSCALHGRDHVYPRPRLLELVSSVYHACICYEKLKRGQ